MRRGPDGLIGSVDGQPVADYLRQLGDQRGGQIRDLWEAGKITRRQTGYASAVVLDLRTGELFEASNGFRDVVIRQDELHPLLAERLRQVQSGPGYPAQNVDGSGDPGVRPHPHPDNPLGHAEVKAVNELLWRRGADVDKSVLRELRVDTVAPFRHGGVRPVPFCANCAMLLTDVPSLTGRYTGFPPGDHNFLPE